MIASPIRENAGSTKWTSFVVVDPLLNTISMKNMLARVNLIEVITNVLHKSSNTDAALLVFELIRVIDISDDSL